MQKRIAFIADPHLAANEPGSQASYEEILKRMTLMRGLELVVIMGDCAMQKKQDDEFFLYAKRQFERLPAPYAISPGNQDVGNHLRHERPFELDAKREASTADLRDNREATTDRVPSIVITADRLRWFENLMAPARWTRDAAGVRVISADSQLCASGLPEEETQYAWLADALRQARQETQYVVLVMHTPPYLVEPNEDEAPDHYWTVPKPSRLQLLDAIRETPPNLMLAGHVHRELHPACDFCEYQTLASPSFQSSTIWSVDTSRVPPGSDDFSFYTLTLGSGAPRFERHVLDHQDRYK